MWPNKDASGDAWRARGIRGGADLCFPEIISARSDDAAPTERA
jgi:hypothetical protein